MADGTVVFDVSDIFERAVKTAGEAALGAVPFVMVTDVTKPALVAAGIAAASAFASVVVNTLHQYFSAKSTKVEL